MFSLGTSVGVLNALLLNGNISFSYITMNTTKGFQSNGLVNDLLLKWNSYNTCIIAETILKTIKLHAEEVNIYIISPRRMSVRLLDGDKRLILF